MPSIPYDPKITGNNLRALRQTRGWTQVDLARKAQCSVSTISALERGERDMSVGVFYALYQALQCDPEELVRGQPTRREAAAPQSPDGDSSPAKENP